MFNFFLCELPINFNSKSKIKKREWRYFQGVLDIEIGRNWSVGLGAPLGDGHTEKLFFFLSFRDFFGKRRKCHVIGFRMYYKATKFY